MSKWVSVEEELPNFGEPVLAYGRGTLSVFERMPTYLSDNWYWDGVGVTGPEWEIDFSPTHWMPLPEPPDET